MSYGVPDKILTMPGAGNTTGLVVRIGACPDDRGISNSVPAFIGHTSGRGAGNNISLLIERYATHGTKFIIRPGI